MPAILGLMLVCGGMAGCEAPTETYAPILVKPSLPPPSFVITAPAGCGQVQFTITGSSSVTTIFPVVGCGSGLVIVSGGTTTWNGTTRILSLRVKVKNTSGQTVEQPIWTQLPDTGRLVTAPAGQPRTQIVPQAPADTLESGGTAVWLVGGSTNLATGSSTPARTLKFQVLNPVTSGTLSFRIRTNEIIVGFPATAPNVTPGWFYHDSSKTSGQVVKRALVVSFKSGITVPEKQAAINGVQGTVVGGAPLFGAADEGRYLVRVPWATSGRLIDSAARVVMTNPAVRYAGKYWFVVFNGRRPVDHYSGAPTWKVADWVFNPDSSSGSNWAPEEAALPLAWGCETGSPSTLVGLVEGNFSTGNFDPNVVGGVPNAVDNNFGISHGRAVASVLAARGDDSLGMAGVAWRVGLHLRAVGRGNVLAVMDSVGALLRAGVSIINLSAGNPVQPTRSDDSASARDLTAYLMDIVRKAPLVRPLFVVAAGNENRDAFQNGFPALSDSIPGQVIVVGASTARNGIVRDRWGGANFVFDTTVGGSKMDRGSMYTRRG